MQELRLVAVSEDGTYLVLATAGRGTRFTLPVDDRLRAAVRGHFSRLGQFEIEVESPLRPKEIQARIRAGETADEIAESAGIPVDRVRWFEGPVLQEREYMAQQAQRVTVRRQGESAPSPPLGEMVEERLGRRGLDLEEVEWDSWKCEDSTWRVRLSFFDDGRPHAAEWAFDPRRRNVSPLDEMAARLSSVEWDDSANDTVTPLLPRRPAMKVVSDSRDGAQEQPRQESDARRDYIVERGRFVDSGRHREIAMASGPPAPPAAPPEASAVPPAPPRRPQEPARPEPAPPAPPAPPVESREPAPPPEPAAPPAPAPPPEPVPPAPEPPARAAEPAPPAPEPAEPEPAPEPVQPPAAAAAPRPAPEPAPEPARPAPPPEPEPAAPAAAAEPAAPAAAPEPAAPAAAEPAAPAAAAERAVPVEPAEPVAEPVVEPAASAVPAPPPQSAQPAGPAQPTGPARPAEERTAEERPAARGAKQGRRGAPAKQPPRRTPEKKAPEKAAPVEQPAAAGETPAAQRPAARNRRKAKGKRASVPSWDEIMFGARRPD